MLLEEKVKISEVSKTSRLENGLRKKFCPIPKIEKSEISENVLSLQILTVVTQYSETTKMNWNKNFKIIEWIRRKQRKLPKFLTFRLSPIPKIKKSEIWESFLLLQIFTVVVTFSKLFPCYFVTFNITSLYFIEVPQVVQKIWKVSRSILTF